MESMTIKEAATALGCSVGTIRNLIARGNLTAVRDGGEYRNTRIVADGVRAYRDFGPKRGAWGKHYTRSSDAPAGEAREAAESTNEGH